MSEKAECPACHAYTSGVWDALHGDGEACPYCGLSATALIEINAVQERRADAALKEATSKALVRADKAEQRAKVAEGSLRRIRQIVMETESDV